jgi:Phosphatidylinositol 3- and 4-kinase/FYVE zinc finger/Phosphoinositide 3-kinase family, accessory domain (PIK domain)
MKNHDPNLNDMSFSMYIESKNEDNYKYTRSSNASNSEHFTFIEKRNRLKWIDSKSVNRCNNCNEKFGYAVLGNGKHHCRYCASVFCDKCSSNRAKIPFYIEVPIPDFKEDISNVPVRVCDYCYKKLRQIKNLENLIVIFNLTDLDIYDFRALRESTVLKEELVDLSIPEELIPEQNEQQREQEHKVQFSNENHTSGNLVNSVLGNVFNTSGISRIRKHYIKTCIKCGMISEEITTNNCIETEYDCGNHSSPCKVCKKDTRIRSSDGHPLCADHFHPDQHITKKSGKMWNQVVNYHLSNIFEMQYYLPNHLYSEYDIKNLWSNRKYFVGHSKWMVQFLRSINFQSADGLKKISEVKRLMYLHLNGPDESQEAVANERKKMCWNLMCTRDCVQGFIPSDAIQLLNDVGVPELRKVVIECLDKCSREELLCYLQLLVHYVPVENVRLDEAILGNYLIRKASDDLNIANELYWLLKTNIDYSDSNKSRNVKKSTDIYQYFLDEWNKHVPDEIKDIVFNGSHLVNILEKEGGCHHRFSIVEGYKEALGKLKNVIFPTNPEEGHMNIDLDGIDVKQSITRPVVIPGTSVNDKNKGKRILHKSEDVRKDRIMMDVIRVMNFILTKELNIDLNIVTYNVLATTARSGLIEMVGKSKTLYSIRKKGGSLLNYALENNENAVVMELRQKFVRSCASYCVITFLLGIGDRHLENIMMTEDGQLFHIDYGFVLGYEPKVLEVPMMRISSEMIYALGGDKSKYYEEFKVLCNQIYTTLRRHVNLFYSMLNLLVELEPPVQNTVAFREQKLVEEIMKRFVPGEGTKEAKIQLDTRISNSTQSYRHAVIDFFHYHAQENKAVKAISKFISKIQDINII